MKIMRKVLCLIISLVIVFGLVGCNSDEQNNDDSDYSSEIQNGDFETQNFDGWTVDDEEGVLNVQTDDWATMNCTYFVKMYSEKTASFSVSQTIKVSESDTYISSIDYEGYESFSGNVTFSVLVNDEETASIDITPNAGWDVWKTASTDDMELKEGDIVTFKVSGTLNADDWGDFDDIIFVKASEAKTEEDAEALADTDWDITEEGAVGSGCIDWNGVTYNGTVINDGNFIKGVDISSIISLENSGVVYYNTDGEEDDLMQILKDAGVNYVRARVWNDPYASDADEKTPENSYGGGVCDLNYTCQIAERCAELGLKLYVDFHFSDFWSDPGRAYAPKAWADYSLEEKEVALAEFATEALTEIAKTGVEIGIVSIGNETNNYMSGEEGILNISQLISAGCSAVRAFDENILIAVHFTNPESANYFGYATQLQEAGADYDIFATSYYPFWHGTTENLTQKMNTIAQSFGKLTMIAEYSYPTFGTYDDYIIETFGEPSEEGQTNAIKVVNEVAAEIDYCIGTFYWEPAWLQADSDTWASEGSGWINAPAAEYDLENSTVSSAQGSGWSDYSLFSSDGHPYDAITSEVFNQIWTDGE